MKFAILQPSMKKKLYTEEDIQKAIWYLKTNHPEVPATREEAIKLLEGGQVFAEAFVAVVEKLKKSKSKKNTKIQK